MSERVPDHELLELFVASAGDYAVLLLDPGGIVRRWNPAATTIFGYAPEEMIGRPAAELFQDPDRRAGLPELELRTAAERGRAEDERWHVRKNGSRFWGSGVMYALRRGGALLGYAKLIQDISERRRLEDAVHESRKLESLGVLAAGVAHDFNNALTAVIGNVALARDRLGARADPELVTLLSEAEQAGQRAADLVRQLLHYAGKGRRVVEPVDVCRVAADALSLARASVSPRVQLRLDLPEGRPAVEADVGQLRQLLLNLILNGVEAIEDGGTVDVRLRVRELPEEELRRVYPAFALASRRYVEILVHDTGRGMDADTLRRIFDPFFTTKFLGRGLGLAAALGIVRSHGGGIAVESRQGTGSTFTVLLPADAVESPVRTVAEAVAGSARGEGLVLVVDDEPGVRSLIQRSVEQLGYTALLAENGRQALEIFERVGPELVLVLLDLFMPEMDGGEAAARLQAARPDLPLVVLTGLAGDDAAERLSSVRVAGFVSKPFTPEQLAQAVAVALRLSGE